MNMKKTPSKYLSSLRENITAIPYQCLTVLVLPPSRPDCVNKLAGAEFEHGIVRMEYDKLATKLCQLRQTTTETKTTGKKKPHNVGRKRLQETFTLSVEASRGGCISCYPINGCSD